MHSFDDQLLEVHRKISIRDEDRQPYTEMYDTVRTWLIREMCAEDPVFNKICTGTSLFGSYPNRVRIIKPTEFDVYILLDFPFPIKLCPHPARPGFIEITGKQWKNLKDSQMRNKFEELFEERGGRAFLKRSRLQRWIESIIQNVLSTRQPVGYNVRHKLLDVSQQIKVENFGYKVKRISIDFVPAIVLSEEDVKPLVKSRRVCIKKEYLRTFVAIPKRLTGCGPKRSRTYTFQLVNPIAERDIIWDKQNLKIVYRLLKSLRNNYNLRRLKSYFLTTIFLHEVGRKTSEFWNQPIGDIFLHMLSVLIDCFQKRRLPFYWLPRFNLLSFLHVEEIDKYGRILVNPYNRLLKLSSYEPVSYTVASHFKTRRDEE